jgi:molecular chaperone GrpE
MSDSNAAENMPPEGEQQVEQAASPDASAARIAELEAQLAEMKNEALRHLADAENTRKRAVKEREDTAKFATAKFAKDMLDVADNLQRALQAIKPEQVEADPALKNLVVGIEATERQIMSVFERFGVKKIEAQGQRFDPNLHQVVNEIDAPDKEAGTILHVLQTGYMIHDRLLREAMVAVAKGGTPQSVDQKI